MVKKDRLFKRWKLWGFLAVVLFLILIRMYSVLTDDFRIANITYEMPFHEEWVIQPPSSSEEGHILEVLDQPYIYLNKGAQSYVFSSVDGKYVLKFFKFKHLRPSLFLEWIPSIGFIKDYKENLTARKKRKLLEVFNSHKLAYDEYRSESCLLFIQLNALNNPRRSVTIYNKIGMKQTVDLQHVAFILQEKGETLRAVVSKLLDQGNLDAAKQRFGQIFDLYAAEYQKGLYDLDHGVMRNTGFIGIKPIHLDVGKLLKEDLMREKGRARQDAALVAANMNGWVRQTYSEYAFEIQHYIDQKIHQLFD